VTDAEWRSEQRGLTTFILAIGGLALVSLVIVIWSVLPQQPRIDSSLFL